MKADARTTTNKSSSGYFGLASTGPSKASGIGTATILRIEKSNQPVTGYASTIERLQEALEDAGVVFIDDDATGGIGLRLAFRRAKRQ